MDFANKIVTVVLVFIMLVVSPTFWLYIRDDMISERLVLNEIVQFIDKATDKGEITEQDIDDLYIGLNAVGGTYDVKVSRYMPTPIPAGSGKSRIVYSNVEYLDNTGQALKMNKGDLVKVSVETVGITPAKQMLWSILKMDSKSGAMTLSGAVR